MVADRIKALREQKGLTQSDLGISSSGVNAWEMKISVPNTQYIVELAHIFKVSTDYLLGRTAEDSIDTEGLTEEQSSHVRMLVADLRKANENKLTMPRNLSF